jgi:tetratricopeptide (TPR) repeat protein
LLDIQAELHGAGQAYPDLYEAVAALKRRHDLHPCSVQPRDGASLRHEQDREAVLDLVSRFRKLPEDARQRLPALMNSLAQLQVVVGDLESSQADFEEVARLVGDPVSRAEAWHNAGRAALERGHLDDALASFRRAWALDGEAFEPFPTSRFEPRRILGAGALGARFHCLDREAGMEASVLALRSDTLGRDLEAIFRDLRAVQEAGHPAVARILGLGCSGDGPQRAYVATEYLDGAEPLGMVIARDGPMSPEAWFDVAWALGRALQALHARGVLHRCLRPSSVLLWRGQVKLIDCALDLRRAALHAAASNPEGHLTSLGRSIAELAPYLPRELSGRPKGQSWAGPHSDIYSFGRLCALALTGKPGPSAADRLLLPEAWQKVIESCTEWAQANRPAHLGPVLDRIASLPGGDERLRRVDRRLCEAAESGLDEAVAARPESPDAWSARGAWRHRQGRFVDAAADFTEALRLAPGDAALLRQRAAARLRCGNAEEAIEDYSASLRAEPTNLEALTGRAQARESLGDHEGAAADFTEALRHDPKNEHLYFGRGNAFFAQGELRRAIADYTEAARLDPRHLWALGNRGRCHLLLGEAARAAADFSQVLHLDPGSVRALGDRAAAHQALQRHDLAAADFTEALRLEPAAWLYQGRGLSLASLGRHAEAAADFTEALKRSPESAPLLLARARALARSGRPEEAVDDLGRALRLDPKSPDPLLQRAEVLTTLGRREEALADLAAAIALAPGHAAALFQRGNLHAEMGDHFRAVQDYSEALRLRPESSAALGNRGSSYAQLGDLGLALADLQQAVALAPEDPINLLNRASLHVRMGQYDLALADFTEALRLDPSLARAFHGRGALLAHLGEAQRAVLDLTEALRLSPDNPRALVQRGNAYAQLGDQASAQADLLRATQAAPGLAFAWHHLGILQSEMGEAQAALDSFSRALEVEPGHLAARINRGRLRQQSGDIEGALADFSAAAAAEPSSPAARFNRARALFDLGRHDEARADLDELLRHHPGDIEAHMLRGRARLASGDLPGALEDHEAAVALAPQDHRAANNLAWLLATVPDESLRSGDRALELAQRALACGEDASRLDTLAAALACLGRFNEAVNTQQRALALAPEAEKDDYASRLELYRAGRPYVQPR